MEGKRAVPAPCPEEFRDGILPGTGCIADSGGRPQREGVAPQSVGRQRYLSPAIGQVHVTETMPLGPELRCSPTAHPSGQTTRGGDKR